MSRRSTVVSTLVLVLLALPLVPVSASPSVDWFTRPGTIAYALSQPDGARVNIDAVEIDKIRSRHTPGYLVIHESFDSHDRVAVVTRPSPLLRLAQTIDVQGVMATLPRSGRRVIVRAQIMGYCDSSGHLLRWGPVIKGLLEPIAWPWKVDLTVAAAASQSGMGIAEWTPPEDPDPNPGPPPTLYETVAEITPPSTVPEDGSLVELQAKPIVASGSETIDNHEYHYIDVQDDGGSSTIRAYVDSEVTAGRLNSVTGQVQDGAICVNDGPGYDPQLYEGILSAPEAESIPYAQTLQNEATTTITGRIVTADRSDFPGALYVQEPLTHSGIRVKYTGDVDISRGYLVNVAGGITLASDGEREIDAGTTGVTIVGSGFEPPAVLMQTKALGGGDLNTETPGINYPETCYGLYNKGMLVKVLGKVTASDASGKYFYVDDGGRFSNGSAAPVKVTWDWPSKPAINPPSVGTYVSVAGISGSERHDAGPPVHYSRVLRVRRQDDIIADPMVAVTSPCGTTWHKAGNSSITVSGTATPSVFPIDTVEVWIDSGTAQSATYSSSAHTWSYNWANPSSTSHTLTVRVTDAAGHTGQASVTVTIQSPTVKYVSPSGSDSNDGSTWALAKLSVGEAIGVASANNEVWVAASTYYTDTISLKSNVGLYGGFAGTETCREQRNWKSHETILDGQQLCGVIQAYNVSGASIDGFTIQNGCNYTGQGGGVNCYNATGLAVCHNTIKDCEAGGGGGGIGCSISTVSITDNFIVGNISGTYISGMGGGICYYAGSGGLIANNTIVQNSLADGSLGGGICVFGCASGVHIVCNNIVAGNKGGGIWADSAVDFEKNYVYGNTQCGNTPYEYNITRPATDIAPAGPPGFVGQSYANYHILWSSPCRNAGYVDEVNYSPPDDALDIDGEARKNGQIDVGADETKECARYTFTLTPADMITPPGSPLTIRADVFDTVANVHAGAGCQVDVSVDVGRIVSVTRNGTVVTLPTVPTDVRSTYGITGTDGSVTITVTSSVAQVATVTASLDFSCEGRESSAISVPFGSHLVGCIYNLCLNDIVNPTADGCETYLRSIATRYPEVAYRRIDDTVSLPNSQYSTVFLILPTFPCLSPEEVGALITTLSTSLKDFVNSGREKRVVLIGEFCASWWLPFNEHLNDIAEGMDMYSRFDTGYSDWDSGYAFDDNDRLCPVDLNHYLMEGVEGLWDADTGSFPANNWQNHARPLACAFYSQMSPWILEEDTETHGSRVLVHDSNLISYGDYYDTIPDKNFKFIYNLCTKFRQ